MQQLLPSYFGPDSGTQALMAQRFDLFPFQTGLLCQPLQWKEKDFCDKTKTK